MKKVTGTRAACASYKKYNTAYSSIESILYLDRSECKVWAEELTRGSSCTFVTDDVIPVSSLLKGMDPDIITDYKALQPILDKACEEYNA